MKRWDPVARRWIEDVPPGSAEAMFGPRPFGGPAGFLGVTGQTRTSGDLASDPGYQAMMNRYHTTLAKTGAGSLERQKQGIAMAQALSKSILQPAFNAGEFQTQNALQTIQSVLADAGLRGRGQPGLTRAGGSPGRIPYQLGWGMQLPGSSDVATMGGIGAMRPLTGETINPLFPMTSRESSGGLSSPEGNYQGAISNMSHTSLPSSANLQNRIIITREPTDGRPGYFNMIGMGASVPESRTSSSKGMNIQGKILTPEDYMRAAAENIRPLGKNKNDTRKTLHWDPMLKEWVNS